ncbi:hypothetical protein [Bacillus wiedmannii]|uniref:hypothetical protein n=1 Tax=Bacillus wiedmannii TaxID=1890302 RepID=UPI003D9841AD
MLQSKLDSVIKAPVLTGLTGPTGATGPRITANNARITNAATQTVAAGAAVPLALNNVINGTAITYVPGSTDIVLAPNQTYHVSYEAESSIGSTGSAQLQLNLNGSLVGGIQASASGLGTLHATATQSLSSQAVINTGAGPNILTLNNTSGGTRDITGANINIIKLQ